MNREFWKGRRVLVTGHTGFKGAWLSLWLDSMGADVTGIADGVPTEPSLFEAAGVAAILDDVRLDIRDHAALAGAVARAAPEVVIHMAAQPLVRRSYREPRETYETNVLGTVNLLEAVRLAPGPPGVTIVVTSDKCYENREHSQPFREDEPLGGHDPYSSSKACAEFVTAAWRRSYFASDGTALASVRAGNVIGGGDWGEDRLVPDFMRAAVGSGLVELRNPQAIRPWQHVLNPLSGYLKLAEALWHDPGLAGSWNFGPDPADERPVQKVADRIVELWGGKLHWKLAGGAQPHEARTLRLDSSKAREQLGWRPVWDLDHGLVATVEWHRAHCGGTDARAAVLAQLEEFEQVAGGGSR